MKNMFKIKRYNKIVNDFSKCIINQYNNQSILQVN